MATVCLEAIPAGSQIGLDLHSWQSGPRFRGLCAISPGLHCLHLTIAGLVTTKYAVWLDLADGDTLAYKWDETLETLVEIEASYALSINETANAISLIQCPAEEDHEWLSITSHMTVDLVREIVPLRRVVTSTTSSNTEATSSELQGLKTTPDSAEDPEYLFFPVNLKRSWPAGAIGRDITEMALDKSWLLKDTLRRIGGEQKFLGQFEFCFLGVLLYSSITAFDQWNTLLKLVTTAKLAIVELPNFFSTFFILLQAQMQQVSSELYADIFALTLPRQLNSIQTSLTEIDQDGLGKVKEDLEVLQDFLGREFGQDEDHIQQQAIYPTDESRDNEEEEEDDEKPVVVDL